MIMMKVFLVIFFFVVLGGLYYYQNFMLEKKPIDRNKLVSTEDGPLVVNEQLPGNIINIKSVSLAKKGFVVIQENLNKEPYSIIGNSRILPVGKSVDIPIGLIRNAVQGEYLYAVAYEDNGDNVFFPEKIDIPSRDEDGDIIFVKFYFNKDIGIQQ